MGWICYFEIILADTWLDYYSSNYVKNLVYAPDSCEEFCAVAYIHIHDAVCWESSSISEEHVSFACFMLVSCLAYSSTLKMGAAYSSETVDIQQTTWH
jgi:hypothetical protein